ncbi:hypothetical protein C2E23DRAFT_739823 [Lenzites betulinus]|nr:hypothetical protein C2E23DRAFT_739823 [Lenzites betulinus]
MQGRPPRKLFVSAFDLGDSKQFANYYAESLSQGWQSQFYAHFQAPKIMRITKADGQDSAMHRFVCKRYPSKHVDRADYEDSMSNPKWHVKACNPTDMAQADLITAYTHGVSYSLACLRYLLALWCARRHCPFCLVEDPELCVIFRMLYDKIDIPSQWTILRDICLLQTHAHNGVVAHFKVSTPSAISNPAQAIEGKVHLCVDGWTSPNVISFLRITVH